MGKSELAAPSPSPGPLTVAHLPLRQSQGRAFGAAPGLVIPCLLVRAGGVDVLVGRLRDQGGSIDEINRTLDTPAGVAIDPVRLPA